MDLLSLFLYLFWGLYGRFACSIRPAPSLINKKRIVILKCLLSNVWFVFVSRKKSESCWTTPATVYLHFSDLCAGGSLQKWRINWWTSYNSLTLLEQFVLNYISASHVCRWWRDVMFNCSCACGLVFLPGIKLFLQSFFSQHVLMSFFSYMRLFMLKS